MTTNVLSIFLNNMKVFVYESGERRNAAENQVLTRRQCSITPIKKPVSEIAASSHFTTTSTSRK